MYSLTLRNPNGLALFEVEVGHVDDPEPEE